MTTNRDSSGNVKGLRLVLAAAFALLAGVLLPGSAFALKPIVVDPDQDRIEITRLGDLYEGRGDSIQLETAPGADGATGRMSVSAITPGTNPNWIVFALTNTGDRPIERWLTADRYNVIGSGAIWPDLDARRIESVTPSIGFIPERIESEKADIFRVTLEPGQTITYVAELTSDRFARLYLWKPLEYELKVRELQLFNGIMLGLTGLLATFLTAIFAANHKLIFPAAALVAWCALALLCVDFGFFHKLFQLRAEDNAIYRAATEAALAASLVIFLHVFLRLALWHGLVRMLIGVWMLAQLALIAIAVLDPRLASTFARTSFVAIGAVGAFLTLFLAFRGQDRALSLIPTWLLFCVWVFGAAITVTGKISGDVVASGLVAGLVLILLSIGFTVTQFAFRTLDAGYGATPSELQQRSLAIDGAGAAVWEWSARRDEVRVSHNVEAALGLSPGELSVKTEDFTKHLHPADREKFKLVMWSMQERNGGRIRADFRLRHADNSYRWFEIDAASIPSSDGRTPKCVGLMRDVTDSKRAHERLMHDAVHDSLTGLPNRELFLDRLNTAMLRAKSETQIRPTLFLIDIDKFKSINASFGLIVGDSLLLTAARRLQRHVGPQDTLARLGGDKFALLFPAEQPPQELASLAERIRRSLRSPVQIAGQEIILTGSVGVAVFDGQEEQPHDLLKEAEIAVHRAKQGGADRIEIFRPEMRSERDDRVALESDLRKAIEKNQLKVFYQPIIYLPTEELAGFEALVRWEHPKLGLLNPSTFIPIAEESDLIVKLGSHVLMRAARDSAVWQRELPRPDRPLFVSINISSRQLFRPDLIQEIRHILGRNLVPKGTLHLEITESLVMENPEKAIEILEWLRSAGADVALDDFGTGYSSLAYLHRLPFDTIKIDRSLVRAEGGPEGSGVLIMRAILALAHELGKKVVAEGVERQEEAGILRGMGCGYAQGFYYGEPIPDKDVVDLLRLVKKSERKLQPRGLFRAKRKKTPDEIAAQAAIAKPEAAGGHEAANQAAVGAGAPPPMTGPSTPPPLRAGAKPRRDKQPIGTVMENSKVRMRTRPAQKPAAAKLSEFKRALPMQMRPSTQPPPPLPPVSMASPAPVGPPSAALRPATAMPPVQPPPDPAVRPAPEAAVVATNEASVTAAASHSAVPPPVSPPRAEPPDLPRILQSPLPAFPNGPSKVEKTSVPPVRRSPNFSMPPPVPAPDPLQSLNVASLPPAIAASLARLAGASGTVPPATQRRLSSHDLARDDADRHSTAEPVTDGPPAGPAAERK
jgi:diguanylate cyclase (GGDEF)-like protein/PAS domain S-box-containing protein